MKKPINPKDIIIRTELRAGDLGYVIHRHGIIYEAECGYDLSFEMYVAAGILEFHQNYDPARDRVWICERKGRIIGFVLLMHRGEKISQLRFFYLEAGYRGLGLGHKLMEKLKEFARKVGYRTIYLWTTHEQEVAISLYKRHGFALTEEKDSNAFGKSLREQKFELYLPG